jgi:hypothetical protein
LPICYTDLNWGIEVEFTGMRRLTAASILSDHFCTTFVKYGGWGNDEYEILDPNHRIWKIVKDASIEPQVKENGSIEPENEDFKCELVSPILTYRDLPVLLGVIEVLRKRNAITNLNCGIHIHLDAALFTPKSLRVLCNMVYSKQYLLTGALNVNPNRKRQYCSDLPDDFIERFKGAKPNLSWEELSDI